MRSLIEQIEFKAQHTPQSVVLADEVITNGITCKELDLLSGRVYAYLKKIGIGKEDFVLINMARGIMLVVAIIGVLKAGAAFTIVEEGYAPERIEYVRNDCGCKTEINRNTWEEILKCEPLPGHEQTDDHDAAFAVYTSGTTGNPKGVLHEYGNIKRCIESIYYNKMPIVSENDRIALLAPMNFVAADMLIFIVLYSIDSKLYIASYSTIKNPLSLKKMLLDNRISITFLSPSYIRLLDGKTGPFLKKLFVGSEPANAAEKALCTAFKKVLNLEKVGIYDDFYELGGDSLGSIEAILESGLPGLEASMIFRGRTAADIAKLYYAEHGMDGETNDEKNKKAMKQTHKLTIEQLYMFDYQLYTPLSTMYNLFTMLKLDKAVFEPLRLSKAAETAIKSHPALLTKFTFNDDGEIVQSYDESIMPEIRVEKISEFDLKFLKDTLVQPFKMINTRLFRCRIFETEKALYLFFDIHHTIFDGTSFKVLINSIAQAYEGVSIPTDYYYFMLKKREEIALTAFYEESRKYFEERYDGNDRITYPTVDYVTRENKIGQIQCEMNIDTAKLDSIKKHFGVSHNEFFITVSAIAVSLYSNNPNVMLSWIYNGREDAQMMNTVGLLYRDLPVAFRFDKNMNMGDIFADVHSQVQNAIEHSCYPYIEKNAKVIEGDVAAVLYQSDIRDAGKIGETDIETVEIKQNRAASQSVLDIEVLDSAKGLRLSLNYSSSRYKQTSMENFGDSFVRIAAFLAHNICENNITVGEIRDEVERNV